MASDLDLSIVIPTHNAADTIRPLVESIAQIDSLNLQIVIVDDASDDDTTAVLDKLVDEHESVLTIAHERNLGAGTARNTGFAQAAGRYTLFFDDDDEIHADVVERAIPELDRTEADVAMFRYRYHRGGHDSSEAMNSHDIGIWDNVVGNSKARLTTLNESAVLLGFSNYPWNKIIRTEHFRSAGLRFGSTMVNNDILGHWYILLFARDILMLDDEICTHIVVSGGANLTNQHSGHRLSLLNALDETYDLLESHPALRNRYSHHYWAGVLRVCQWAADRIDASHIDEFNLRLQQHLLRANLADFGRMRLRRSPAVADEILKKSLA